VRLCELGAYAVREAEKGQSHADEEQPFAHGQFRQLDIMPAFATEVWQR
jgi:hypothetical protein